MSKRKSKKKNCAEEPINVEDEEASGEIMTRRKSKIKAVTPNSAVKNLKKNSFKTNKLNQDQITNELMDDANDESIVSVNSDEDIGKSENNIVMDDDTISCKMTIKRLSDKKFYEVTNFQIGMKKKIDAPSISSETIREKRNRKSTYTNLCEDSFLNELKESRKNSVSRSKRESTNDVPKTPKKRPPTYGNEIESASEVDENIMPNANVSPKRSKVAKVEKILNTPKKVKTTLFGTPLKNIIKNTPKKRTAIPNTPTKANTPKKEILEITHTPSKKTSIKKSGKSLLDSPTKAFGKLQIETSRTRNKISNNQNSSKHYSFRTKNVCTYKEHSSNSESCDDDEPEFNTDNESASSDNEEDYESDDSEIYSQKSTKSAKRKKDLMKTPSKNKLKTPSKISMDTPTKLISRMSLNSLTPSVHRRTMNIVKPSTPLQEARQKLHVSVLPKSLPCREEEFNNIYCFLHARLSDLSGGCIYVSGVPGTGKTATVNEVIRCLKKAMNAGKLNEFEFVEINGMKLSEPRQAYVQIWKQLTGNQTTWEDAYKSLNNRFNTSNSKRGMTLLLVDELDLLCTKRQDVVYNLLDWPSKSTAKLVVVTIANTMDLPERILMGRVTSRLGLTRLTFQPYNHKQLEEIVASRLKGYNAFSGETVQLVARKVAAVSGDARRALDICRRATEVAEMNDREMVTMMDVKKALDEMIASPKIQAIKACSDLEKIFLQAVCAEVQRTGVEEVVFKNVYFQLETLCPFEGEKPPGITEALSMCARLGAWRLLLCDHSRLDIHQRLLLNVSTDDVYFAIRNAA